MEEDFSDIKKALEVNDIDHIRSQSSERIKASRLFNDAIKNGNLDMVQSFIDHGVSLTNAPDIFCLFPIEEAAARDHLEIVKLLLSKGCSVNPEIGRDAGFATVSSPLVRAVYSNNEHVVKFLLENGADQNLRLHTNTHSPLYDAVDNSNEEIIDLLLEYKPDFKWLKNKHAISLAARQGKVTILEKMLKSSKIRMKSVKSFNSRGFHSPLDEAVLNNNFECVKVLIKYGANPNAATARVLSWDSSPICFAILKGNVEILDYLIKNGGKFITNYEELNERAPNAVYIADYEKGRLIEKAEKSNNPEMIKYVKNLEEQIFNKK